MRLINFCQNVLQLRQTWFTFDVYFLQNCWQPVPVHNSDAKARFINTPLHMCREKEM